MKYPVFISALLLALIMSSPSHAQSSEQNANKLPEFTHHLSEQWINSKPLSLAKLKGKIVLIDFWTFDCWNCYRSFPWLNALEKKYQRAGLQLVGVHTPEFKHEKIRANIEAKVKQFQLHHPIMMDNDFSYWKALNNRYWPAYYLINQQGDIVYGHIGETHQGDRKAIALEKAIKQLITVHPEVDEQN